MTAQNPQEVGENLWSENETVQGSSAHSRGPHTQLGVLAGEQGMSQPAQEQLGPLRGPRGPDAAGLFAQNLP